MNNMIYVCIPTTKERRTRLNSCIMSIKDNAGISNYSIVTYENYKEGCQVAVRKMISGLGNRLVIVLNDDMIAGEDFLKNAIKEYLNTFPEMDGLGSLNEGNMFENVAIVQMAPAKLLYDYLYKGYFHYRADNEIAEIFKNKGKFLPIKSALIDHVHPDYNPEKMPELNDDTYKNSRNKLWKKDKEMYKKRKEDSKNFTDLSKIEMNAGDYINGK